MAKGLKQNSSLKVLDVSWNGFAEESCRSLAQSLVVNTTLQILDLTQNRLESRAATFLSKGLSKNHGVEILILDNNNLGDDGVKSILHKTSHHPTLRLLSLQGVHFTEKIHHQLVRTQSKRTATLLHSTDLDISNNLDKLCHVYLSNLDKFVHENEGSLKILFAHHDPDKGYHLGKEGRYEILFGKDWILPYFETRGSLVGETTQE